MDPTDPTLISVYHMVCFHGHLDRVKKLTQYGVCSRQQVTASNDSFSVTFALYSAPVGCQAEVVNFLWVCCPLQGSQLAIGRSIESRSNNTASPACNVRFTPQALAKASSTRKKDVSGNFDQLSHVGINQCTRPCESRCMQRVFEHITFEQHIASNTDSMPLCSRRKQERSYLCQSRSTSTSLKRPGKHSSHRNPQHANQPHPLALRPSIRTSRGQFQHPVRAHHVS